LDLDRGSWSWMLMLMLPHIHITPHAHTYIDENFSISEFLFFAAWTLEQKEEKTSKLSQPVAMFPCVSSPAVCTSGTRAIYERGVRNVDTMLW
jgi:hypothetical protein